MRIIIITQNEPFYKKARQTKNCGQPETQKVGPAGTKPYKMSFLLLKMSFVTINVYEYTLLVLNRTLYIDDIALAIVTS